MKKQIFRIFEKLRFKQKLFLSYLVVIIIPILMLGTYAYNQSVQMLNMQAEQSIERNVSTVTENLNNSFTRYTNLIHSIVRNGTFQRIIANDYLDLVNLSRDLKEYLNPYFNMMMSMNNEIRQMTIYVEERMPEYGQYLYSSERITEETWFMEAPEELKVQWFIEGGNFFAVSRFPRTPHNEGRSLLYMRFNERLLLRDALDLVKDYGIVITDAQHNMIYMNAYASGRGQAAIDTVIHAVEGKAPVEGRDTFIVRRNIQQTDWVLHSFVAIDEVSEDVGTIINATIIVIGLCLIILLVVISIFSRTMIRRIHKLNSLMKRVEEGELGLSVQSASQDEIGELTNRFGNMLVQVNELIKEVYTNKLVQKEAELKALQAQINPHFLYNTLSYINWEAIKSDFHQISNVVTALSKFYRTTLNKGDNIIAVKDEIENIKSYLDIMQIVSNHSFDVTYDLDEATYSYTMINLILQPLIENAIEHGLNMKEDGRGSLHIQALLRETTIEFIVADNGPGIKAEVAERVLEMDSAGYGLKNVNERLQLFFGKSYGVQIHSVEGEGTCMIVTIPQYRATSSDTDSNLK